MTEGRNQREFAGPEKPSSETDPLPNTPRPTRRPARRAAKSAAGGGPSTVGLVLRFALNAPPFGLRRAPLRSKPTDGKNQDVAPVEPNANRRS